MMKPRRRWIPEGRGLSTARLIAVQALYRLELAGGTPEEAVEQAKEFAHKIGDEIDDFELIDPDPFLTKCLVHGVIDQSKNIDKLIDAALTENRSTDRLETLLRITIRAGVYEILDRTEIDPPIVINEYVDIAKAFFAYKEPALVNGVLDSLARKLRPNESMDSRV